jgi:hypothetical protein
VTSPRLPELPGESPVHVRFEADDDAARLVGIMGHGVNGVLGATYVATTVLCEAPCDKDVPRSARLFVSGVGIVTSRVVTLDAAEHVKLVARVGHTGERTVAVLGLSFGIAGLVASLTTLLLGSVLKDTPSLVVAGLSGALGVGLTIAGTIGFNASATRVTVISD